MAETKSKPKKKKKLRHRVKHKVRKVKGRVVDKNFPGKEYYLPIFAFVLVSAFAAFALLALIFYDNYRDANRYRVPYHLINQNLTEGETKIEKLDKFEDSNEYTDQLESRFDTETYLTNILLSGLKSLNAGNYSVSFAVAGGDEVEVAKFTFDEVNGIVNEENFASTTFFVEGFDYKSVESVKVYLADGEGNKTLIASGTQVEDEISEEDLLAEDPDSEYQQKNFEVSPVEAASEYGLVPVGIVILTR